MSFGPHSNDVEEVVDFVKNGYLLTGADVPSLDDVLTVCDLERAQVLAWEETFGNDEFLWSDIRQKEMSNVKAICYTIDGFNSYRDNLTPLLQRFTLYVRRKLSASHTELLDDIVSDLYNCAFNRCVQGTDRTSFFEKLLAIYRSGGWPCGWDGDYPKGRLAVYLPQKD